MSSNPFKRDLIQSLLIFGTEMIIVLYNTGLGVLRDPIALRTQQGVTTGARFIVLQRNIYLFGISKCAS